MLDRYGHPYPDKGDAFVKAFGRPNEPIARNLRARLGARTGTHCRHQLCNQGQRPGAAGLEPTTSAVCIASSHFPSPGVTQGNPAQTTNELIVAAAHETECLRRNMHFSRFIGGSNPELKGHGGFRLLRRPERIRRFRP
jgi:hypothetical protein